MAVGVGRPRSDSEPLPVYTERVVDEPPGYLVVGREEHEHEDPPAYTG